MIVRQRQRVPASVLYCAGGGVALIVATLISFRLYYQPVEIPVCSARYLTGVRFNLARQNGEPLTVADLQARFGGRDWGLGDNASIVRGDEERSAVLEIGLDPKPSKATFSDDENRRGGIGFTWSPRSLPNATAACLGYNVFVPAGFDFGAGGVLPGFASDAPLENDAAGHPLHAFSLPIRWGNDGALGVMPLSEGWKKSSLQLADKQGQAKLQKGRWMRIEQEVVLNTPGESNGLMRLWVDGEIRLERSDMTFRMIEAQKLSAVQADVHLTDRKELPANKRAARTLKLSPLELRIQ